MMLIWLTGSTTLACFNQWKRQIGLDHSLHCYLAVAPVLLSLLITTVSYDLVLRSRPEYVGATTLCLTLN